MSSCCWPAQRPRTHSLLSLMTRKLRNLLFNMMIYINQALIVKVKKKKSKFFEPNGERKFIIYETGISNSIINKSVLF